MFVPRRRCIRTGYFHDEMNLSACLVLPESFDQGELAVVMDDVRLVD